MPLTICTFSYISSWQHLQRCTIRFLMIYKFCQKNLHFSEKYRYIRQNLGKIRHYRTDLKNIANLRRLRGHGWWHGVFELGNLSSVSETSIL